MAMGNAGRWKQVKKQILFGDFIIGWPIQPFVGDLVTFLSQPSCDPDWMPPMVLQFRLIKLAMSCIFLALSTSAF
jgi:hypothetical protein